MGSRCTCFGPWPDNPSKNNAVSEPRDPEGCLSVCRGSGRTFCARRSCLLRLPTAVASTHTVLANEIYVQECCDSVLKEYVTACSLPLGQFRYSSGAINDCFFNKLSGHQCTAIFPQLSTTLSLKCYPSSLIRGLFHPLHVLLRYIIPAPQRVRFPATAGGRTWPPRHAADFPG